MTRVICLMVNNTELPILLLISMNITDLSQITTQFLEKQKHTFTHRCSMMHQTRPETVINHISQLTVVQLFVHTRSPTITVYTIIVYDSGPYITTHDFQCTPALE